jgi:hypothetical protein
MLTKVDGFSVVIDPTAKVRIKEVLDETRSPISPCSISCVTTTAARLFPASAEGKEAGAKTLKGFTTTKRPTGAISIPQIGLLNFNFSPNVDFNDRHHGALAEFKKLLPNNTKIFERGAACHGKRTNRRVYDSLRRFSRPLRK